MDPATPPAPPPPQVPLPAPRLRAEDYRDEAARIIGAALTDDTAYRRLAYLGDRIGHRLSGSAQLERAIEWAVAEMKKDKLDNVRTEKVMVPHWVRGAESLELLEPASTTRDLAMLGLGNSIGTAPEGLTAEAVVVRTFDELDALGEKVRGKIVVYNVPFTEYGATVQYRGAGPSRAARYGAVAALVRSVGPVSLQTPHTGSLRYDEAQPRIPAAAVTIEAAEMMQRMQARGEIIRLRLKMEASFRPDAESANVVAELKGREQPEEIVLVGGHFDSWDVGQGAHDDGGGCIVSWEVARLLKELNLRPRRTIRVVLFTNEENGLRGGNAYRDAHAKEAANHVFALESDSGVFTPARLGFTGSEAARKLIGEIATLLAPIGMQDVVAGGGGADIGPIATLGKVPMMAYAGDATKYFTIHHTPADTVDRIDPQEVSKAAASIAAMVYVIADMPQPLPK